MGCLWRPHGVRGVTAMVKDVSPFVGQSRLKLVEGLVEVYEGVCSSRESRWVSLEAPSGWGKTRVGKRFYAELAARQKPPRYWPETLGETSRDDRKLVAPRGKREEGSLPDFLWWGISCSSDERFRSPALRESLSELVSHGQYVSIACSKRQTISEKAIDKVRRDVWQFAEGGAMELLGLATGAIGASLPGMGLAVLALKKASGAVQGHRADKQMVGEESEIGASTGGLVDELTRQFSQIGREGFPVVLFVEDVHFADEALLEALNAMLRRVSHLLVVTTAWPGRIDEITELSRLSRELDERVVRVMHDAPTPQPLPAGAGLAALDSSDCRKIVLAHYERANPGTADRLANRYRNPGALDLVCSMEGFREDFGERGDLYISREEVDDLPVATEELYRAYWDQLPKSTRLQYAVAAAISPASINPDEGAGHHTWSSPVLNDVIRSLKLQAAADLHSTIGATTDAYGWVTHVDEYLRRWSEIDQHYIASDAGSTLLKQHRRARKAILTAVADVMLSDARPRAHAARTIVALHAEGFITCKASARRAVTVLLDDLGYDDTAVSERIHLYDRYRDLAEQVDVDEQTDFEVRLNGIDAIASSGRYVRAVDEYRDLHARTNERLGSDHPLTLKVLYNLAVNLDNAGQGREAVETYEHLCAELSRVQGEKHQDTLSARFGLAEALGNVGRDAEAVSIFEQVVEDRADVLGEDHPDTSASRHGLAHALVLEGRSKEVITVFERVLADRVSALGDRDPATLKARLDLAKALGTNRVEGFEMLEEVLADRIRVLGENHPDTWEARGCLAEAFQHTNRWGEATAVFEQVVSDRVRLLGEDHPDTLDARYRLAKDFLLPDRRDEALDILEQVLADRVRVLGEDHPDTMDTRDAIGFKLFLENRFDDALHLFDRVLADRIRLLGEDHPDTLETRGEIAWVWSEMGRVDDAIDLYDQLASDAARVLGVGSDRRYYFLGMKAEALRKAGRIRDALTVDRQCLEDQIETLGQDHPSTLEAIDQLSFILTQQGDFHEAIAIQERLLDDRIRAFGDHHESVSSSRRGLGVTLMDAGRFVDAIPVLEQLVADSIRMYREDDSLTLSAKHLLGSALLRARRIKSAIAIFEEILPDCKRVLGDHSPETESVQEALAKARSIASRLSGRTDRDSGQP